MSHRSILKLAALTLSLALAACGGGTSSSAPVLALTAAPLAGQVGQSVTLSWSSSNATSCVASGSWQGPAATSGTETFAPSTPGTYTFVMTCSGPDGSDTQAVTVTIDDAPFNPPTASLTADPSTVGVGASTTLTWSSTNAQSCSASGEWSGSKPVSGSQSVTITTAGDHSFTITCGGASSSVTVSATQPTLKFSAFPPSVVAGNEMTLDWEATSADSCVASGAWSGALATSGRQTLVLSNPGSSTFTVTCSAPSGPLTVSRTVTTTAAPALPPATTYHLTPDHAGSVTFAGGLQAPASQAWSVDLGATVSYPIIAGGLVIVTLGDNAGSYGTKLIALNAQTGATVWGPVSLSGTYFFSNAAYGNGKVFVVNFDGLLRSFDAQTGVPGWSLNLPGQYAFSAPPSAFGGIVFVGGAGGAGTLYAVDESNGQLLWTAFVENGDDSSPAVTSSGVYVTYPCQTYDFAPTTGEAIWHQQNGCEGGGGKTSAVKGGVLYGRNFSASGNSLDFFDADDGTHLGAAATDVTPAVTSSQLFILAGGNLQALDVATGATQWSFAGDGQLVSAPIVVNNRVFVGSATGEVFAVDVATGAQKWNANAGASILATDEQNVSSPRTGLGAGEGWLVVPAGNRLTAWRIAP